VFSRHRRLDDGPLQRAPVAARRLGAEIGEAEPAGELLAGIVALTAPAAAGMAAGAVPEPAHQATRLGELVAHPGRHDGVAARHRQPGQRIGQSPAGGRRPGRDLASAGRAGDAGQPSFDRGQRLGFHGAGRAAKLGEEGVEGAIPVFRFRRAQPVPRRQQLRRGFPQRPPLIAEDLQREAGIELRVVPPPAFEAAVPVVLDEAMVGIAGKSEGPETQRIDGREPQQPQAGLGRHQMRQVEGDQVVAQNEGRSVGEAVQFRQRRRQVAAAIHDAPVAIRTHAGEGVNAAVRLADFEIQREAAGRERHGFTGAGTAASPGRDGHERVRSRRCALHTPAPSPPVAPCAAVSLPTLSHCRPGGASRASPGGLRRRGDALPRFAGAGDDGACSGAAAGRLAGCIADGGQGGNADIFHHLRPAGAGGTLHAVELDEIEAVPGRRRRCVI